MSSTLADRKYESESRCRTARGVAEVTSVEPGQAPLHHEAFQPGQLRQRGLSTQTGVEIVQRADLARGERVVVRRVCIPSALRVQRAGLRQDLIERSLTGDYLLTGYLGVGRGKHRRANTRRGPHEPRHPVPLQHRSQLIDVGNAAHEDRGTLRPGLTGAAWATM